MKSFQALWYCYRCHSTWWGRKFDDDGNPVKPVECPRCKRTDWSKEK